jgi:HEAT repeat protein
MGLFGPPDIAKLKAKRDIAGLVKALIHPKDRSLAVPAAAALGEIRDPRAVPLLIAALGDKDWKLRAAAAEALGKIGDPRAAQPLIAILVDSRWDVRSAAEEALEQLDARAVDPLVTALKDGGVLGASGVRGVAARTLGQIGDLRAVEPLVAAL